MKSSDLSRIVSLESLRNVGFLESYGIFKRERILVTSGGFDPIHAGHVSHLQDFKSIPASHHIIALNGDSWLERKKGLHFMPWVQRARVIEAMSVGECHYAQAEDDTVCRFLTELRNEYPFARIIFCKGGDRNAENIPEMQVEGIEFVFGVGGSSKKQSSSHFLESYYQRRLSLENDKRTVDRPWGWYMDLMSLGVDLDLEKTTTKVKVLTMNPKSEMSVQRHKHRSELWFVESGTLVAKVENKAGGQNPDTVIMSRGKYYHIPTKTWHQLTNPSNELVIVIEIQDGTDCNENDIERVDSWNSI